MTRSKKNQAARPVLGVGGTMPDSGMDLLGSIKDKDAWDAIHYINDVAPRLNDVVNRAASVIEAAEKFLQETGVGVSAAVVVTTRQFRHKGEDGTSVPAKEWLNLQYGRPGGQGPMRIFVRTEAVSLEDESELYCIDRLWSQCPREVKQETFPSLTGLLQAIAKQARESLAGMFAGQDLGREISGEDGNLIAKETANHVREKMFHAPRGWLEHPDHLDLIAIFGNDGWETPVVQREIQIIADYLEKHGHKVIGISCDDHKYSWAMIVGDKAEFGPEALGDVIDTAFMTARLEAGQGQIQPEAERLASAERQTKRTRKKAD